MLLSRTFFCITSPSALQLQGAYPQQSSSRLYSAISRERRPAAFENRGCGRILQAPRYAAALGVAVLISGFSPLCQARTTGVATKIEE